MGLKLMETRQIVILFLATYSAFGDGAKILGVFNHPGASHTFLGKTLLKALAEKGHEVVMISSFPMKDPVKNYRDIVLAENLEDLQKRSKMYFNKNRRNEFDELKNMTLQHTEATFTNPDVQELIRSKETFDVIIIDWFFNEATLIFGKIYNAPVIYMSSFGNMALITDVTGNTLPISYVPGAGLIMSDDMPFKHRLVMTLFHFLYNFVYIRRRNEDHCDILRRHFGYSPTTEQLQENVALVLSNSHFSFESPRPYTPGIVPIGGFHVQNLKELPTDLKEFLDDATEGVIYFSLGSQIKGTDINKEVFSNITEAFGQVSERVLWKYDGDDLVDLSENVKIVKWVPQLEVLAHPNVKLFITHGGILSVIEAIHFAVPVVCLPVNGDQNTNAAFIQSRNIGLYKPLDEVTSGSLLNLILEVLSNSKYKEEMEYRSLLLRQQPIKPMDAAIYWVEHVIQHKHGKHLKTFATKLPWYKYYLVDVLGFLLCTTYVLLKAIYFIFKKLYSGIYRRLTRATKAKIE